MQPLISAMTTLREVFAAAVKSLLRGKSFIQAILAFWISPAALKDDAAAATAAVNSTKANGARRSVQDFLKEAEELLLLPIERESLKELAAGLKAQFRDRLLTNASCMLPSYNHQLPNGVEQGQFLALDVGGSTLRVALVELRGREARGAESKIVRKSTFKITPEIKSLEGLAFFDWMAHRISETISSSLERDNSPENPILLGLAWSFPIEYVLIRHYKIKF